MIGDLLVMGVCIWIGYTIKDGKRNKAADPGDTISTQDIVNRLNQAKDAGT